MSPTASTLTSIGVVIVLIFVGAIFAAAEMALVSLRESQVSHLKHKGKRGKAVARLCANPNRYLSAVQVGVTLSGFLSAALGGDALGQRLAPVLARWMPAGVASTLATVLVTIVIAYFSIVLSELSAKRIAMQRAEGLALVLAPMIDAIATIARPIVWFLGISTDLVVRLVGGDPKASREEVTDEELRAMVQGATGLGDEERQIVDDVFSAGDRTLREVMVPRTEVDFLAGDLPAYKAMQVVQGAPHSRYPVTGASADEVIGFLHVRDLMGLDVVTRATPVAQLARPIVSLPESVRVLRALTFLRSNAAHLAVVSDEYGGTAGIVTLEDLVEELIGDITDEYDIVEDPHGNDVDGLMTLEDFAERFGYELPEGPYDTVAGFVMARLGHLPNLGDSVSAVLPGTGEEPGEPVSWRLTVTELDGRRAARVSLARVLG